MFIIVALLTHVIFCECFVLNPQSLKEINFGMSFTPFLVVIEQIKLFYASALEIVARTDKKDFIP